MIRAKNHFMTVNRSLIIDGTIVFTTLTIKVWIGNFRTRIEAERNLVEVKTLFTAFNQT
jgi:hypothetical protein